MAKNKLVVANISIKVKQIEEETAEKIFDFMVRKLEQEGVSIDIKKLEIQE